MIPFDISAAIRNTLVPTSSIANLSGAATSSQASSSLLRSQLNNKAPEFGLTPMFNFANPPVNPSTQASQIRKHRLSNTKKPPTPRPTPSNIDSMISLQQRYNGNITRPPDNISDLLSTKNNSANLSILPDTTPLVQRRPSYPVSRQSPSLNKTNPTNVNIAKERQKITGNTTSAQNLPMKTPPPAPIASQKAIYSDLIRGGSSTQPTQFSRPNIQSKSQTQKEIQTLKSRQQPPPTYIQNRVNPVNVQQRTSTTNSSPSQSARTTPVKSIESTSVNITPPNRVVAAKKRDSYIVNSGAGNSNKVFKLNNAPGSSSGNPVSQQVAIAKTLGIKTPTRIINTNQGLTTPSLTSRTEPAAKVIKPGFVPPNRSNTIQITTPRSLMSSASQNSIPQKDANVRFVGKSVPIKQATMPKKVVLRPPSSATQSSSRDVQKYHIVHATNPNTTQSPISITKLVSPVGSDIRSRPTPMTSSAVSLHKIQPSGSKLIPSTSTSSPTPRKINPLKRTIEVS